MDEVLQRLLTYGSVIQISFRIGLLCRWAVVGASLKAYLESY